MKVIIVVFILLSSCISTETKKVIEGLKDQRDRIMALLESERRKPEGGLLPGRVEALESELKSILEALTAAKRQGEIERAQGWQSVGGAGSAVATLAGLFDGVPGVALGAILLRALSEAAMTHGKKKEEALA